MLKCENWCTKIRAYSICLSIYAYVSMSNLNDSDRASSSKDTVLCACDCANCKGTFYCYSTVRRHHSIFGVNTQAGLRLEGLGVSCGTREASVAGGFCFQRLYKYMYMYINLHAIPCIHLHLIRRHEMPFMIMYAIQK